MLNLGGGWLVLNLLMNFSIELGFGDWSLDFLVLGVAGFFVVLAGFSLVGFGCINWVGLGFLSSGFSSILGQSLE